MTFRKKLSVSLAVTSGIALTVGGLQFANAGGAEHQKAKAKAKETPSMVSAAFGDTEHLSEDEARKRLARQGKVVATAKKVRKDLKPGWSAGDYVDPKDGTLTVNVTSKRRAEDVDAPNVTPRVVSRSTTDLNAVKVSVDKLVERFTPSGVTYYIDVRKNVVTVEVARTMLDKGRTGEFVDAARKLGPAVEVKTVDKQVAPTTNMQDGDEISTDDGDTVSTCSMGWWVKKDGEDQVMTAGHCLVDGDGIWTHEGNEPIGRKDAAKFGPMDWGTIRVEPVPPSTRASPHAPAERHHQGRPQARRRDREDIRLQQGPRRHRDMQVRQDDGPDLWPHHRPRRHRHLRRRDHVGGHVPGQACHRPRRQWRPRLPDGPRIG